MLELAEVSFDQIALAIDVRSDRALDLAIFLGRDVCARTDRFDPLNQGPSVITAIGDYVAGPGQAGDQFGTDALVGGLALRQGEADGQAMLVDDGV